MQHQIVLDDSAINIEGWLTRKAQDAVKRVTSQAIVTGTGIGMPIGLLNPVSGIPICEVGTNTPAGQISWQDLVMLVCTVPMQYHAGASFLMNQRTSGDAADNLGCGRPLRRHSGPDLAHQMDNARLPDLSV